MIERKKDRKRKAEWEREKEKMRKILGKREEGSEKE